MSSTSESSVSKGLRKSPSVSSSQTIISKNKLEEVKKRAYRKNKLFRRIEADIKERDRKRVPGTFTNLTTHTTYSGGVEMGSIYVQYIQGI